MLQNGGTSFRLLRVLSDPFSASHIKMAEREEAVRGFVAVTDVDEERARFFLESAGWDLQVSSSPDTLSMRDCAVNQKLCEREFRRL